MAFQTAAFFPMLFVLSFSALLYQTGSSFVSRSSGNVVFNQTDYKWRYSNTYMAHQVKYATNHVNQAHTPYVNVEGDWISKRSFMNKPMHWQEMSSIFFTKISSKKIQKNQGFISLGGMATSHAAIASSTRRRTDVFVRGEDNSLYTRVRFGTRKSSWSPWYKLGGQIIAAPTVATRRKNDYMVAVTGTDRHIYLRRQVGSKWKRFIRLPSGHTKNSPAIAYSSNGKLQIFVRGLDNILWHCTYSSKGQSPFVNLGGKVRSAPSVVSEERAKLTVAVRGGNDEVWLRRRVNGGWRNWYSAGGAIIGAPALVKGKSHSLKIFAIGKDKKLWAKTGSGRWKKMGSRKLKLGVSAFSGSKGTEVASVADSSNVVLVLYNP